MGWLYTILNRRISAVPVLCGCAVTLFLAVVANRWSDPVAAAWAQAVGTIAAVGIALMIANRQLSATQLLEEKREQREIGLQQARARATASRLSSLLFEAEQSIETAEKIAAALCESLKASPFIQDEALDQLLLAVDVPSSIYDDFWTLEQRVIFQITYTLHGIVHYNSATLRIIDAALADATRITSTKLPARSLSNLGKLKVEVQKSLEMLAPLLAPILR